MVSIRGSATRVGGDGGIGGDLGILGVDLAAAVTQPAATTNFCGVILKTIHFERQKGLNQLIASFNGCMEVM
ncbi:hypothetical protein HanXRQr2_Chr09g0376061 [Helianthus annuus]|uniref:Uncharacterized protein n=1 Tax=Helianthus annuus TaxID=4232 RepID=A0A251TU21_HELAN|nr:hypothetical protein HanXRQr2_Chr09g0376061 [Helianthus annuus]KAJ0892165.1 hypothetical protein HanPSC8_Chr09g0362661 [Helianthus annuus]